MLKHYWFMESRNVLLIAFLILNDQAYESIRLFSST